MILSVRLDSSEKHYLVSAFSFSSFFFSFFWEVRFSRILVFPVGSVHCLRDPQIYFFNKIFIKNGSHNIIYTFKNYFATLFSVFSKISSI